MTSHNRLLKRRYKERLESVLRCFNSWDPLGLHGAGAPAHEYSLEAAHLLTLLPRCRNSDEVSECTRIVLAHWFGKSGANRDHFAREVWEQLGQN